MRGFVQGLVGAVRTWPAPVRWGALAVVLAGLVRASEEVWPAWCADPLPRIDAMRVDKSERRMELLADGAVVRSYAISLGGDPVGPKRREGDSRTPEGVYTIDLRNAGSRYHRSLRISYPSAADVERARRAGVPPGGDIMIHGVPNGLGLFGALYRGRDWTDGCIAVTTVEMAEIWSAVPLGARVEIVP